jgi:hypothetical protein
MDGHKSCIHKKPKGEGFDQKRGTSCVHKQYKEENWRKTEMTENQEREKEMSREVSREKVELHLLPKRKQASMPTWCMLHCLIGLAE